MACTCKNTVNSDCSPYVGTIASCIEGLPNNPTVSDMIYGIGSLVCNFYDIVDTIVAGTFTVEELDGSPSYASTNILQFNQDNGFIVSQPSANTGLITLIPTFLFPDGAYITVDMVSTGNITLANLQNIDGQTGIVGSRVLAWQQSTKSENGVYVQVSGGAWTRATDSNETTELNNQVVFANYTKTGTSYGGKYFNQIIVSPTIGVSDIVYQLPNSGNKQAWLLNLNTVGEVKSFGTVDAFDIPFYTENVERMRLFNTTNGGGLGIGITGSALGTLHVQGNGLSPLYVKNTGSHSFEFRESGQIYRNRVLYSFAGGSTNTSWGVSTLAASAGSLQNTVMGYQAGQSIILSSANTLYGYKAGNALTTTVGAGSNVFVGNNAGVLCVDGVQNTGIGNNALGNFTTGAAGGNTAIGYTAGLSSSGASVNNIYIGSYAGRRLYSALPLTAITGNTFIGTYCGDDVDGAFNILIGTEGGWNLETGNRNIFIGHAIPAVSFSSGDVVNSVSTPDISDSLSFGNQTTVTANNQIVMGSSNYPYTEMYIGEGVTSSTPQIFTINTTGGSGTDIAGGHLIIASGKSTGSATPPSIIFRTSVPGSTGSTPQTLGTKMTITGTGTQFAYRAKFGKGTDTAAANDLTLPLDGNLFFITGNTQINRIAVLDWQAGSEITLIFTGTPTIKHNQATGGGFNIILLNGSVDLVAAPNTVLKLIYDGVSWQETTRKVA
jgi:hypothetical protein